MTTSDFIFYCLHKTVSALYLITCTCILNGKMPIKSQVPFCSMFQYVPSTRAYSPADGYSIGSSVVDIWRTTTPWACSTIVASFQLSRGNYMEKSHLLLQQTWRGDVRFSLCAIKYDMHVMFKLATVAKKRAKTIISEQTL